MLVEEAEGEAEHVLEVEPVHRPLPALVPVVDPEHQLRGDGWLVGAELGQVASRRDHPVLRPFDLAGQLPPREELVRRGQRVRQGGDQGGLVVEDLGKVPLRVLGPEARELGERRRMERSSLHPFDPQRGQPALELACGLVGEGHGEDPAGGEGAALDLVGDAVRDGRGLAGAGTGQDRHRPSDGECGFALCVVQPAEGTFQDSGHLLTLTPRADTNEET